MRFNFVPSLLIALLVMAPEAFAQSAGTILGTVRDASGGVLPGASVTVLETGTNWSRTVTTDGEGNYIVPNLSIGTYEIAAELTGFEKLVQRGVRLQVAQQARVNFELSVGQLTDEVTVTGTQTLIKTDDATLGGIIGEQQITELPMDGRNFAQLAHLIPGVNAGLAGSAVNRDFGSGIGISSLGQRDIDNSITLDGAPMHNSNNNATRFLPSIEAIQEFNVQTGIYSAEYGGQSGAHVNVALKSGTNRFQSTLFEFVRNDALDARDYFGDRDEPKLPLRRHQFGGVLTGPIRRNETFFMLSYEGLRERRSSPVQTLVPTSAMRAGDFSAVTTPIRDPVTGQNFPGNQIPSSRFSSQAVAFLSKFIATPNLGENAVPNYRSDVTSVDERNQWFSRVDHKLSDTHRLFGRFGYSGRFIIEPEGVDGNTVQDVLTRNQNVVVNFTSVLGSRATNELKVSYNRDNLARGPAGPGHRPGIASEIGLTGVTTDPELEGLPAVGIAGFGGIAGVASDQEHLDDIAQIANNFSYVRGAHFFKMGLDIQKIRQDKVSLNDQRGSLTFSGQITRHAVADFLLGYPHTTSRGAGIPTNHLRQTRSSFYFLDDWKAGSRLTLNLGLRYEYYTVITDRDGTIRTVDFDDNFRLWPEPGVRAEFYKQDPNNFAPRIGAAYRPFSTERTVLRAGAGIFYNQPILNNITITANNPPYGLGESFNTDLLAPNLRLSDPFPSGKGQVPAIFNLTGIDPDYQIGYNKAWTTNIQQMFGSDWVAEIGYAGSRAEHLDQSLTDNLPPGPGPGNLQQRRPVPTVGSVRRISTSGFSTYHALLTRLEKRFNGSFSLLTSYTLSKTLGLGYGANIGGRTPQNAYDLSKEVGPMAHHRKHNLVMSAIYMLPRMDSVSPALVRHFFGDWQLNSILTLRSGEPFTVTRSGNPLNHGGSARPDRICDGRLPRSQRSLDRYFDTSCFVAPPPFTYGDSGVGILDGPGEARLDMSLVKNVPLAADRRLQLRLEVFNATNTPSFGNPGSALGSATFGRINSTKATNREIQLGIKFYF